MAENENTTELTRTPVSLPGAGKSTTYQISADMLVVFDFDTTDAVFSGNGNDLVITTEDGGTIVFQDYLLLAEQDALPTFELIDGEQMPGDVYLFAFNETEEAELETAADSGFGSSGAGDYTDDSGDLFEGYSALDNQGDPGRSRGTDSDDEAPGTYTDSTAATDSNLIAPISNGTLDLSMNEDGTITITDDQIKDMFTNTDGGDLTVTGVTVGDGSITDNGDGTWTYTPDDDYNGDVEIEYTVNDGKFSATGTGTIDIDPVNDAATFTGEDSGAVSEDLNVVTDDISVSGTLDIADIDAEIEEYSQADTMVGEYGTFSIGTDGDWSYVADNTQVEIQELPAGDTLEETFTVKSVDGTEHEVTITINGTEDNPTITGETGGALTEDAVLSISGDLATDDVDAVDTPDFNEETLSGSYGSLSITEGGTWTYTLDDRGQSLTDGQAATETFTVTAETADGETVTETVTVSLTGSDDVPTFSGADTGTVTEDINLNDTGALEATGTLVVTDADAGESVFVAETVTGTYGSLAINTNGGWTYTANNEQDAIQQMDADSDPLTDTITVTSADGSTHDVVITINGTDDAPEIGGTDSGSVTEDLNVVSDDISATGTLTIDDADAGESTFVAETIEGTYGDLSIGTDGVWDYVADNNQTEIQELAAGGTLGETFTVETADGTEQTISITINGTEDNPTITGETSGALTEDAALSISGDLATDDVDAVDTPDFNEETLSGSYGSLSITEGGTWTYTLDDRGQTLADGQAVTETFTVTAETTDGETVTETVTVSLTGSDDIPTFSGADSGTVTEDVTLNDAGALEVGGTLVVSDDDAGESVFVAETQTGTYGSLSIGTNGVWTYTADNTQSAVQGLEADDSLPESFTVTTGDGTTHVIDITINGTEDDPTISGQATGTIGEDDSPSYIGGKLTATDFDTEDVPAFEEAPQSGTYGDLSIDANGNWTYTLNDNAETLSDETVTETFTVTAETADGETVSQDIVVTVNGVNDAPESADIALEADNYSPISIDFDPQVTDTEDDASGDITSVRITGQPDGGTLYYNGEEVTQAQIDGETEFSDLDAFTYEADDVAHGALIGSRTVEDNVESNWGELVDGDYVTTLDGGATVTVSTESGSLTLYDAPHPSHIGAGMGDNSGQGINAGDEISVSFDGANVSYAMVGLDGLGGHFSGEGNLATATWTATLNGVEVGSGDVWDDNADGNYNYFENLEINSGMIEGGLFDTLVFSTESTSGSNWVLRYVDAEFTHDDSFTYVPVDSDGADGNQSTVSISVVPEATINDALEVTGELDYTMNEDGTLTITAANIAEFSDLDNTVSELNITELSFGDSDGEIATGTDSPLSGALTDNGDGTWTFEPTADWNGELNLNYTVSDGSNEVTGSVDVTVNAVNDIPIGEDFTVDISGATGPVGVNFVGEVSDVEDANESLGVVIRELPEDGTLLYNGNALSSEDLTDAAGNPVEFDQNLFTYEPGADAARPVSGAFLGTRESEDWDIDNWGQTTDDASVRTMTLGENDEVTITISSDSGPLNNYNADNPSHMGFGIGDSDGQGINDGEHITIDFDGAKVSYAEVGLDGLGGHFVENAAGESIAQATWSAYNGDVLVAEGLVNEPSDGLFETITITQADLGGQIFDSIVFGTDSDAGSNWELRYVDTEFAYTDSFVYAPVDSDPAAGNDATVDFTITYDSLTNEAPEAGDLSYTMAEDGDSIIITEESILEHVNDLDNTSSELSITSLAVDGGTLAGEAGGPWTFTPDTDWNGTLDIDYTVTDGTNVVEGDGSIVVTPVNDGPSANADTATVGEDGSVLIDVLNNDSDLDGDDISIQSVGDVTNAAGDVVGTAVIEGTEVRFTPNENYNGDASFDYTITDGAETATATATIDVTAVNDGPTIDLDGDSGHLEMAFQSETAGYNNIFGVYQVDADGNPSNPQVFINNQNAGIPTGHVIGTLAEGAHYEYFIIAQGSDKYPDVSDDQLSFDTSGDKLILEVDGVASGRPVYFSQDEENPDTLDGRDQDHTDRNGVSAPGHFIVEDPAEDGSFIVRMEDLPNGGDHDYIDIVVKVSPVEGEDGTGFEGTFIEDAGSVYVASAALDIADIDSANMTNAEITLTNTMDSDELQLGQLPDGITATTTTDADGNITVTLTADAGTAPTVDFESAIRSIAFYNTSENPDTADRLIEITVSDDFGATSNTALSTIHVVGINDRPDARNDSITMDEDSAITIDVDELIASNDIDPEGDTLTLRSVQNAEHGTVSIDENGDVLFTPETDYNGPAKFTYTVDDGHGGRDTATVNLTIDPTNDVPVAVADIATTDEDISIDIDVLTNDENPDGGDLALLGTPTAEHGTVTVNADSTINYTPDADYNGSDTITYTITDASGDQSTSTVSVTVDPTNDNPVAIDDEFGTITTTPGVSISVDTPGPHIDPDQQAEDWASDGVTVGAYKGDALNPTWTNEGGKIVLSTKAVDSDRDGDKDYSGLAIKTQNNIDNGEIDVLPSGNGNAHNNMAEVMVVSFESGMDNVQLELAALFDGTLDGAPYDIGYTESARIALYTDPDHGNKPVLLGHVDVDGSLDGLVSVSLSASDFGDGTAHITKVALMPLDNNAGNFSGNNSDFLLKAVSASTEGSIEATYLEDETISLDANELITAANAAGESDYDIEGDTLEVISVGEATHGEVSMDASGNITFEPEADFNGQATFEYTISDGQGGTDTATVTLNIAPVAENEAPTLDLADGKEVTFESQDAGYTNMLGIYSIEDGEPTNPEIILTNSHDASLLGNVLKTFEGDQDVRFFLISDAGGKHISAQDAQSELNFVKSGGNWELAMGDKHVDIQFDESEFNPNREEATFRFETNEDGSMSVEIDDQLRSNDDDDFNDLVASVRSVDDGTADYSTDFTEGDDAVSIAGDVDIADVDSAQMSSATVVLTNAQDGDVLNADSLPDGMTAEVIEADGVITITLNGDLSLADYQDAIQSITYENTTAAPDETDRDIEVTVYDETGEASNTATTTIAVADIDVSEQIVLNPSFEAGVQLNSGWTHSQDAADHWENLSGDDMEVWTTGMRQVSQDGVRHMELDYDRSVDSLSQTIATQEGENIKLSFEFAPRPHGAGEAVNNLNVLLGGEAVATVEWNTTSDQYDVTLANGDTVMSFDYDDTGADAWTTISFEVEAPVDHAALTFSETGVAGENVTYGAMIDNVQVVRDFDAEIVDTGQDVIEGTQGDDFILGADRDVIDGTDSEQEDADIIDAGTGDDAIYAGDGADLLVGGEGDDFIFAGGGDDQISAGTGDNYVITGEGSDTIYIDQSVLAEGRDEIIVEDFTVGEDVLQLDEGLSIKDITLDENSDFTELLIGDEDNGVVVKLLGVNPTDFSEHQSSVDPDTQADDLIQYMIDSDNESGGF